MHGLDPLVYDLMLISVYAAITTLIFKKLKQPIVLGYIVAGIFAGPYMHFLPTVSDQDNISIWGDIGVIFLLFSLGLEFSFNKMVQVGKSALFTASLNIFTLMFCGYYVGLFLGWSTLDSFFLGSMISMSSTTIIIKAFDDLNIKKQKFTDLVFGELVIEDMLGILMLVLLPTIALGKGLDGGVLWVNAVKLLTFLVLCFIVGIYVVPTMLKKLEAFLSDEMLLLVATTLLLSMVCLAVYFGFSSALGAFVMGSILSEAAVVHRIENVIKPLKDFFGAVFFVTVGMMVDPMMFITYAYPILIVTAVVVIGKPLLSVFGFVISGQNLKTAIAGGFSLAQVGEFGFIIAALGMSLKVLDGFVYSVVVAVSVVTTFLTPMMMKAAPIVYRSVEKILPKTWRVAIETAAKPQSTSMSEEKLWKALFKSYFSRILLFSVMIYTIFMLFAQVIRPFARPYLPDMWARILLTTGVLLAIAPFLKGLIGWNLIIGDKINQTYLKWKCHYKPQNQACQKVENATDEEGEKAFFKTLLDKPPETVKNLLTSNEKIAKIYKVLWYARKTNRWPLLLLTSFRLLLVMFFIITAVHEFLTDNTKVIFVLLLATLVIISRSKWLLEQYLKMEEQFLHNLNGEPSVNQTDQTGENS